MYSNVYYRVLRVFSENCPCPTLTIIPQSSPGEMEVDVEDSPTTSPVKQNGMVVEVAGPVVIQYKDKKNREKVCSDLNFDLIRYSNLVMI